MYIDGFVIFLLIMLVISLLGMAATAIYILMDERTYRIMSGGDDQPKVEETSDSKGFTFFQRRP